MRIMGLKIYITMIGLAVVAVLACGFVAPGRRLAQPDVSIQGQGPIAALGMKTSSPHRPDKVVHTDAEWKKLLTAEQYEILRQEGTEQAFTGALANNHRKGTYVCAACGLPLFDSSTKFESGTGWPSFFKPIAKDAVWDRRDTSLGMVRDEIVCARCDGHLGHVFDDGPAPTGLRFCMNSAALRFIPAKSPSKASGSGAR